MLEKKEWESIIGHTIRNDTFYTLNRILFNDEDYNDVIKDLDSNREKYNIKSTCSLVKEKTINDYIEMYNNYQHIKIDERNVQNEKEQIDIDEMSGIYGIYIEDKLVYIGKTMRNFKERFLEHQQQINSSNAYLYRTLRAAKQMDLNIKLTPLIIIEELKVNKALTNRDINMMELALIQLYQPKCNIQGRLQLYPVGKRK